MLGRLTSYFATPEDRDPAFIRLTRNIMFFTLVATLLSVLVLAATPDSQGRFVAVCVLGSAALLEFIALLYVIRGKVAMAKIVIPPALVFAITVLALSANSIHDVAILGYPLIIIIATLLQGRRSLIVTTSLSVLALALLGVLDMTGRSISPVASTTGVDDILLGMLFLSVSAAIVNLLVKRLRIALARAEANEHAQIKANRELRELQRFLEQHVEQRTTELMQRTEELESANRQVQRRAAQFEALAQAARAIASVRDLHELLPHLAAAISERFGFYHVGVFLLDEAGEYALLSAANSPGGRRMLARKHRLRVAEEGIVGYVTSTGEPRIAMDVGKDPVFFNNPDLPDTHSELAVPLRIDKRVVGALDVQSQETGAFRDEDVQMLSLLADQVSLAIENARLFEETRTALAEAEAVSRQFVREAWARVPVEQGLVGYRYSVTGAAPLQKPLDLAAVAVGKNQGRQPDAAQVVIPIELRGEIIGNLVVQSPTEEELNQDQLDLIRAVAERVALSAENARLFEETTRRAERERLVSDITSKIRGTHDPQSMVQTALDELRKALGASRVEVIPRAVRGAE